MANIDQITWETEEATAVAYISTTAEVDRPAIGKPQSLRSMAITSKNHDRWVLLTAPSLGSRVGAWDMLGVWELGSGRVGGTVTLITAVNLDVAIMYVVGNYRNWKFNY